MLAVLIQDRKGEGSTPATIAQALVSEFAFLVDAPVTVTLSSSGTGIVIALTDASIETGYSYALTTASFYPAVFGTYGSFSGSQTSGTLTGSGSPTTPPRDRFDRAAGELETMRASYQFAVAGQVGMGQAGM